MHGVVGYIVQQLGKAIISITPAPLRLPVGVALLILGFAGMVGVLIFVNYASEASKNSTAGIVTFIAMLVVGFFLAILGAGMLSNLRKNNKKE